MKVVVSAAYSSYKKEIIDALNNFEKEGRKIGPGKRNILKAVVIKKKELNIKAFKIPNVVNKIAYRFFRKSKAERSFIYASELLKRGINTPAPVAYAEETTSFSFLKSYYVSEHLEYDLTFRDIDLDKKGHEKILRAFTRFTFKLHEEGIEFLDHSPGNTLIQINEDDYKFYLVDLNRMNFKSLNFNERMKNFERLTPNKKQVEVMADEYAKLINRPKNEVFEKMWSLVDTFFKNRGKNRKLKQQLKKSVGIK
ncbi:lipopolysaccharide kinase InaA family protein [Salinimicrobium sp. WS361]|uniref:lipopolysaccharide kinase InaA family protein n=1 Tax=Salinimicrobium sp. WS361 TaxID=3425123 RepID=UPI003D6FB795